MASVFRVYFSHLFDDEEEKTENDDNICVLGVIADSPEEAIGKIRALKEQQSIELSDEEVKEKGREMGFCTGLVIHDVERLIKIDIS